MSIPAESQRQIRFGEFRVDLETAELRNNGNKTSLQGQPLQILALLLERPGKLVTREELKRKLWPSDTFVDFDQSLNRAVNRLREALDDSAEQPRFIETLPRRGYRFIAPIIDGGGNGIAPTGEAHESTANRGAAIPLSSSPEKVPASNLPVPARQWNWKYVTVVIAAAMLVAAVGLRVRPWLSRRPGLSFDSLQISKLTDSGAVKNVAISHDGRYVAYAVVVGEKQGLRLRQVATGSDLQLLPPDAGNFVGLMFSPDGNYIYFVRSDRNDLSFRYLYSMPVLGGTPRKLMTDVDSGVAFSPDGREIAYEHWIRNDMELKVALADGTGERVLTVIHNANFLSPGDPGPDWSPDGRTLVFSKLLVGTRRRWVLYAVAAADGTARELYTSTYPIGRPVWMPSGDLLLLPHYETNAHGTQLWTVSFPYGVARQFTHDVSDYSMDLDLTKDGGTVAAITATAQAHIWVFPSVEPTRGQQITSGEPPMFELKENSDGRILSTDWDGVLWIMNPDGTQRSTFGNVHDINWFTRCGRFVVVASPHGGTTTLTRLDADGTNARKLVSGNLWSPSCSQNPEFVYYVNTEQPEKIWRIPMEGGAPAEVAQILGDSIMGNVNVSPDGTLLAYPYSAFSGVPSPGRHLAVIPAAGGPPVMSFDIPGDSWNVGPYWTSDSTALRYQLIQNQVSNIWEQPLAGGPPKQLTRFTSGQIFDFDWPANNSQLFVTRGSVTSDVVLLSGLH
jgi:DNA-binding winged helix-turn-helix (wHTH) protein/Tol biopolymer transport system component